MRGIEPEAGVGPGASWPDRRTYALLLAAILVLGFVLRLPGIFDELWLDEIWSLDLASRASGIWAIFTGIHHDNNHWLYTVYLKLLGERAHAFAYRIPSLVAGVATIGLLAAVARRYGRAASLIAAFLATGSFILVEYSSEARGYALAACLAVLSYALVRRYIEAPSWLGAVSFGAATTLGFLSHLTFVFPYGAMALASVAGLARRAPRRQEALLDALRLHAWPAAFLAVLYLADLRFLARGESDPTTPFSVLEDLLHMTAGIPRGPLATGLLGALLAAILAVEVVLLRREDFEGAVTLAGAAIVAPGIFIAWKGGDYAFARHLLVSVPFILLGAALFLARLARRGRWALASCAIALLAFAVGNGAQLRDFFRFGRGQYLEALTYMAENTEGPWVTISGDHDFRESTLVSFYGPRAGGGKMMVYLDEASIVPSEWAVTHDPSPDPRPPREWVSPRGKTYELVRRFPYAGASGWNWFVYRAPAPARGSREGGAKRSTP